MTVLQAIRKYNCGRLDGYNISYKNLFGESRNTHFKLEKLKNMPVKAITINFPTKEVEITLETFE